jgi:hypothetical protein
MSIVLCNEWVVNTDQTVIYYDAVAHPVFKTGKKNEEGKYEHVISFAKETPFVATQITGYQFWYKSQKVQYVVLLPIGRALRKDKKNVQLKDDVEIMLGLKEGQLSTYVEPVEPVVEPVEPVEPVVETVVETVVEPVVETVEPVQPAVTITRKSVWGKSS